MQAILLVLFVLPSKILTAGESHLWHATATEDESFTASTTSNISISLSISTTESESDTETTLTSITSVAKTIETKSTQSASAVESVMNIDELNPDHGTEIKVDESNFDQGSVMVMDESNNANAETEKLSLPTPRTARPRSQKDQAVSNIENKPREQHQLLPPSKIEVLDSSPPFNTPISTSSDLTDLPPETQINAETQITAETQSIETPSDQLDRPSNAETGISPVSLESNIGIAIGALLGAALLIVSLVVYYRRSKKRISATNTEELDLRYSLEKESPEFSTQEKHDSNNSMNSNHNSYEHPETHQLEPPSYFEGIPVNELNFRNSLEKGFFENQQEHESRRSVDSKQNSYQNPQNIQWEPASYLNGTSSFTGTPEEASEALDIARSAQNAARISGYLTKKYLAHDSVVSYDSMI
jgi:hypothetical protein